MHGDFAAHLKQHIPLIKTGTNRNRKILAEIKTMTFGLIY